MSELAANELSGPAALPRRNGELVFAEPWEGRAFGIAVALTESGAYEWEEFRQRLIAEIDADPDVRAVEPDAAAGWCGESADDASRYYQHWLASLEQVVVARGLLTEAELGLRESELAAAHDHDHVHTHAHSTREVTT